jgi:hypothetical protein
MERKQLETGGAVTKGESNQSDEDNNNNNNKKRANNKTEAE